MGSARLAVLVASMACTLVVCIGGSPYCSAEYNCCEGTACPTCTAPKMKTQRVRREIRTLSPAQLERFANAVNLMKNTSTPAGQSAYGMAFKTYDYFVAKHAVASTDSRGDQGDDDV